MKNIVLILPVLPHYRYDFIIDLNSKLKRNNMNLTVIAGENISRKNVNENLNIDVKLIKNNTIGINILKFAIQWQLRLIRTVIKIKPDKVIMLWHAGKINYNILLLILFIKKIPYVLWGSGSGDKRRDLSSSQLKLKSFFKNFFVKNSSSYISYGTDFFKELIKNGYDKNRIFVAQNTIKVENIYNYLDISKRSYNKVKFLFVGVLIANKKLDLAIKICRRLVDEGFTFTFDIVGDGVEFNYLNELITKYNLREYIFLHGSKYKQELKNIFIKSNVFILPGTGGLAINEAMAYSLPVISTSGDGTGKDLITNNINGFLLDDNYKEEILYEKIKFFLNADKKKLKQMGSRSLSIIKQKVTMRNMVEKFYESILN